MATIQVTTGNDDGTGGTLREAIDAANNSPGADSIVFTPPTTATLGSGLSITDALTLNAQGTTIDGGGGTLVVEADVTVLYGTINNATVDVSDGAALNLVGTSGDADFVLAGWPNFSDPTGSLNLLGGESTLTGQINLATGVAIAAAAGSTLNLTGGVVGNGNALYFTGAGDINVSGPMTGLYTFDYWGTGTLTVSAAASSNTFEISVYSGTLAISHAQALGSTQYGTSVEVGATLQLQGDVAVGAEALSLMGGSGVDGGGALRSASGDNSFAGLISLQADTTIGVDAGSSLTLSNRVANSFELTKVGEGTLILSGANLYGDVTTVSAGTLVAASATALGATLGGAAAGTIVSDGATLGVQGGITIASEVLTLNGEGVDDAGALRNISGTNGYTGAITLGSDVRIGSSAGSINLSGGVTGAGYDLTVGGAGNVSMSGVVALGAGALTKDGAGTLSLSAANTYTGLTTVTAGTLQLSNGAGLGGNAQGTVVSSGATLIVFSNITVASEALTLSGSGGGAGALFSSTGVNTYGGAITLAADARIGSSSTLNITGSVTGADTDLTVGGSGDTAISGVISLGEGGLTKSGAGVLTLSAANSYEGATTIGGGTIRLDAAGGLDAGTEVTVTANSGGVLDLNGHDQTIAGLAGGGGTTAGTVALGSGTLTIDQDTSTTWAGAISGSGDVVKAGTGTLTLSGASTHTAVTTVSEGTLIVGDEMALGTTAGGTVVSDGATLEFQSSGMTVEDALTLNGDGVDGGGALRNVTAGTNTYDGAITLGSDTRIESAAGAITLRGSLTSADHDLTLGGAGNVSSGAVIALGLGGVTKVGAGSLNLAASNTYAGLTTVAEGTLMANNATALGAADQGTIVNDGATLSLRFGFTIADEALTLNGGGVGGAGALLNFSGANFYGGVITLASDAAIGASAGTLTLTGGVSTAGHDLTVTGAGNVVVSSTINGSGGLAKEGAGTLTLSGNNGFAGGTEVRAGTLVLDGGDALADNGDVSLFDGATLELADDEEIRSLSGDGGEIDLDAYTLTVAQATDREYAGEIVGSGGLTKQGSATLTLSGTSTYSGPTTVLAGALEVTGALASAVTVAVGATLSGTGTVGAVTVQDGGVLAAGASPGVLSTGDLTLAAGAILEMELGGTAGGQFDQLLVTGTVDLTDASLEIVAYGGFSPVAGDSFVIIDNDGTVDAVAGEFDGFADDATVQVGSLYYRVDYDGGDGNDVVLTVTSAPTAPATDPDPGPSGPVGPTPGADRFNLDETQLYFDSLDGDDYVVGGTGNNTLLGGQGDDSLFGGVGDDVLMAGTGANQLRGGEGQDSLTGGSLFDDLHGNIGNDTVRGGAGEDWVVGGQGQDVLFGDEGTDLVLGNLGGDVLDGGEGNDTVRGGQADDSVAGGVGDDFLAGDRGSDTLSGGAGADIFHSWWEAGVDVVSDFSIAEGDRVSLFEGSAYTAAQVGEDTVITITGLGQANTAQLVLQNVQLATLGEGWII